MQEPDPEPRSPSPSSSRTLARAIQDEDLQRAAAILSRMETLFAVSSVAPEGRSGPEARPDAESGAGRDEPAALGEIGAVTDDRRFVPFYFTDAAAAREYAREHALAGDATGEPPVRSRPAVAWIRACLDRDVAGIVVDPGSPHAAALGRQELEQVAELLAAPEEEGETEAEVADEPAESELADDAGEREGGPEGTIAPSGGPERLAPPPHLLDLADRVRRSPSLDAVPPPDVDAGECRTVLREVRELARGGRMPPWEVVDTLAFRLALHVPVSPRAVRGLRWPLAVRNPRDGRTPAVAVFADEADAAEGLSESQEPVESLRLSGLEAFRWILAAPLAVEEILVFAHPSEPPLPIPDGWALAALYPHCFEDVDLHRVDRVPLEDLGRLAGARGTKPECVRALVDGASELVEPGHEEGEPVDPIAHSGRRFRPIFSSRRRLLEYQASRREPDAPDGDPDLEPRARDRDAEPPFRRWLIESSDCDGVILDPDTAAPLALDHTDLAVLALWAEDGTQPDGRALAAAAAEMRDDLGAVVRGRILGDWPRYYWAVRPEAEEGSAGTLSLPGRDACPVFTSEEAIRRFLEAARARDLVDPGVQPLLYLTSWAFNVFQEMRTRYRDGGWIDPDPEAVARAAERARATGEEEPEPGSAEPGGLAVTEDVLRSALGRIEWRLQPRVPGFLARE